MKKLIAALLLLPALALANHTCVPGDYFKRRECFLPTEHPDRGASCARILFKRGPVAALRCVLL